MSYHMEATGVAIASDHLAETAPMYQEGISAGVIGAATISLWFLILDTIQGHPLYTPTVLGTALSQQGGDLVSLQGSAASFEVVLVYTWIHGLVFALIGGIAARLLAVAEERPNAGFGILLLFVVFEFGFVGAAMWFAEAVVHGIAWPSILVGNLLAAAAMAAYFRHRHPHLKIAP